MTARRNPLGVFIRLEDRIAPVIGQAVNPAPVPDFAPPDTKQFTAADLVAPGKGYDGVVKVSSAGNTGTGSLIQTGQGQGHGHHVITVAHHTDPTNKMDITFTMPRTGYAKGVTIPIAIPTGESIQVRDKRWTGDSKQSFDIAIIRLADPDAPTPAPDRLLVAPFKAEAYELYGTTDDVPETAPGKLVSIVGYGGTGAGKHELFDVQKRVGKNTVDMDGTPFWELSKNQHANRFLSIDFDNGKGANDYFGTNYGG
ncbi:MAG: hypothetical protein L0241_18010, partial [Planctomycetia bacterium]|nr:hypothetical protein [Planctomycetia bacterium]